VLKNVYEKIILKKTDIQYLIYPVILKISEYYLKEGISEDHIFENDKIFKTLLIECYLLWELNIHHYVIWFDQSNEKYLFNYKLYDDQINIYSSLYDANKGIY
jgi:L-rhamnose mutarotase